MTEATRGVLETSVLIDHDLIAAERLPDESAITAVTLGSTAVRCGLGTNVRQGFCCRKSSRAVKQGAPRGLAHCLDRCGQWIATLHTQSL